MICQLLGCGVTTVSLSLPVTELMMITYHRTDDDTLSHRATMTFLPITRFRDRQEPESKVVTSLKSYHHVLHFKDTIYIALLVYLGML